MKHIHLLESIQHNNAVLFLGEELSTSAGLPGWKDFIAPLAQLLESPWPTNQNDLTTEHFLRTALYYENLFGRHALIDHLRISLKSSKQQPSFLYNLIVSLPIRTVFTTNYDNLLERAFQQVGREYDLVVEESELAFWNDQNAQIIKLCGDLTRPDSIIITQHDFNTYFFKHPRLTERLRTILESKTALFLGYSFQTPFFHQIWDNIGLDFGKLRRRGYIVLYDASPLDVDNFQHRGMQVINLEMYKGDKTDVLEQWLKELHKQLLPHYTTSTQFKGENGSPTPSSQLQFGIGKRWAILVGVNEYEDKFHYGQLNVCAKDVHSVREHLIDGGFEQNRIRLLTDDSHELPTRDNTLVVLKAIAEVTEQDDLLLFYYSGHGDEDEGESYLVMRNGRHLVLSDTAVSISRIKEILSRAKARAKVIILDACHSGADIGKKGPKKMSAEFIQRVFEQAEGMAILASCKQGQVSYEWNSKECSVFTYFLLKALAGQADFDEKGFVTVQDVNRYVVDSVTEWAAQKNTSQTPTLQYTVAGDIILCWYKTAI